MVPNGVHHADLSSSSGATAPPAQQQQQQAARAVIKNVDMSDEMQQLAVDTAQDALNKFTVEKDIAAHIKREMDRQCGPTWHTVVGANFGSYVTHETNHFIYFYLGKIAFLIWRA
ncbi:cytoplasmic dynein light chain [Microstroma glucosiphilum]|uniref:Dynein light chain n=1 Tax=Pseudomicrostroma glucosiphilum TaxID=1684307 RepID=A0A316UAS1_9BASI|nr:cytoplasmic dynein light chain [Pseudomicrostroma glucosiphilum]PWN21934.1 cytoplasmic dynein light chain [Pseudomicrostroma glucosiphilum]